MGNRKTFVSGCFFYARRGLAFRLGRLSQTEFPGDVSGFINKTFIFKTKSFVFENKTTVFKTKSFVYRIRKVQMKLSGRIGAVPVRMPVEMLPENRVFLS